MFGCKLRLVFIQKLCFQFKLLGVLVSFRKKISLLLFCKTLTHWENDTEQFSEEQVKIFLNQKNLSQMQHVRPYKCTKTVE